MKKFNHFIIPWIIYFAVLALTLIIDWILRNPNNPLEGGLNGYVFSITYYINYLWFVILAILASKRFQHILTKIIAMLVQIGAVYLLTTWILLIYAVNFLGDTL